MIWVPAYLNCSHRIRYRWVVLLQWRSNVEISMLSCPPISSLISEPLIKVPRQFSLWKYGCYITHEPLGLTVLISSRRKDGVEQLEILQAHLSVWIQELPY
jgi:hypothetical protein